MDELSEVEELVDQLAILIVLAEAMRDTLRGRGKDAPPVWEIVESLIFD